MIRSLLKIPDSPNARRCKDTGEHTCGRQQAAEATATSGYWLAELAVPFTKH
jgi:hypothetical protein